MDESIADRLKETLDLFILKRLSDDGPLSAQEIQRRAKPMHNVLDLFAARKGQSIGSLQTALQRLLREGLLKSEPRATDASELEYSLTTFGQQRVSAESARVDSLISQFVEAGDMDKSFRKYLDRRASPGGN